MYDVQTILSAYDKQGTLVQWLKNLDETLKTSGLESVNTIPVEGGYKLQFKFANGAVIESDTIQKITTLDIEADSVKLALTDTNGVLVEYYSTLTVNSENVESNIKILFPIKGSDSVIVDVGEDGKTIEIHLDADILNDINRALKTPLVNPSATELVAIDTNGAQTMLEIGQGLKVEAGILEAEATGGGGLTFLYNLTDKGNHSDFIRLDYPDNVVLPFGYYLLTFSLGGYRGYAIKLFSDGVGACESADTWYLDFQDNKFTMGYVCTPVNYSDNDIQGINFFITNSTGENITTQYKDYFRNFKLYKIG